MSGGNKKDHIYFKKPASKSCRFVWVCVTFFLPSDIKGLILDNILKAIWGSHDKCMAEFARLEKFNDVAV